MKHMQLYYPNLTPKITNKLAVSFLHWDSVTRIFPEEGTASFRPSEGIISELEEEGILKNEPLSYNDIEKATNIFRQIISIAKGKNSEQKFVAMDLVKPRSRFINQGYYIYKGKMNENLIADYPQYFKRSKDLNNNEIFFCTKETGLTYMTLLAYFLNKRKNYGNTITDQIDAFPVYIALNKLLDLNSIDESLDLVSIIDASNLVEKIFYMPLLKVLEPAKFEGEDTIRRIIDFRSESENNKLRVKYLRRIDSFLSDLKKCKDDECVKETALKYEEDFQNHLKILIAACEKHSIPVNKKILNHGCMNGWDIAGRLWDKYSKIVDIVTFNYLAVVKPILKLKPTLDFYNNTLKKTDDYYPLLIQETFNPNYTQRIFARINQLGKIKLKA